MLFSSLSPYSQSFFLFVPSEQVYFGLSLLCFGRVGISMHREAEKRVEIRKKKKREDTQTTCIPFPFPIHSYIHHTHKPPHTNPTAVPNGLH